MTTIKYKFESPEAGDSKIFVPGVMLSIDTKVEVISKAGNIYKAILTKTYSKIRDGHLYDYSLLDGELSVADLDELLGLL